MDNELLKAIGNLLDEKLESKLEEVLDRKLEVVLDRKLDEKLAPIHTKLDEHSAILNEHSAILNEHSAILNQHSETLVSHSVKLDAHESMLKEQYLILKALEHASEVGAAERVRMQEDITYIKGAVRGLHSDVARLEELTAYNMAEIAKLKAAQ